MILVFLVSARSNKKIQVNGHEHANAGEMTAGVAAAHDRASDESPVLHSGARLAAKLNTKIILNDTEFNHPGEMSVEHRRLYHEALAAVFPASMAVSVSEARTIKYSVADRVGNARPRWRFLSLAARLFG